MTVVCPIESFAQVEAITDRNAPVVTMFSGGADSSYLLLRLKQLGFSDVHAVTVNVGAPMEPDELAKQKEVAAHFGAQFVELDGRQAFVNMAVRIAIHAQARYFGKFPISSSLSRPVIAKLITDYAEEKGAKVLLHTANRSQNSLPRLNNGIRLAKYTGQYGSPYALSVIPREDKVSALADAGLKFMSDRTLSGDKNLWCNEFESGPLDDPQDFIVPPEAYIWTQCDYTSDKAEVTLRFQNGNLVSVNGEEMSLIKAIEKLNTDVGKFGIGRHTGLEHILPGDPDEAAVLEVREAPAATIIFEALDHLASGTLCGNDLAELKINQQTWALEAAAGRWGSKPHKTSEREIAAAMKKVGGEVTFILSYKELQACKIIPSASRCVRDRDEWELQQVAKHEKN